MKLFPRPNHASKELMSYDKLYHSLLRRRRVKDPYEGLELAKVKMPPASQRCLSPNRTNGNNFRMDDRQSQ